MKKQKEKRVDMNRQQITANNVIWNTIGTSANAFLSLFFLIIVTRINGVEDAGVFSFSFSNACILSVVGMYMGRTYQVSDAQKTFTDSDYIYNRCVTCFLMAVISLAMVLVSGYPAEKAAVFLLVTVYKMMEAFSDVLYGIIQKNGCLHIVGKSFTIKAICSLVLFIVLDSLTHTLWISCLGICGGSLAVILVYDVPHLKQMTYTKATFQYGKLWLLFRSGFAICITTLLSNFIVSAAKYAIDVRGYDSFQAVYGIILMPATVLSLLGQFIIHPSLMELTMAYYNREFKKVKSIVVKMIAIMGGFGLLALAAAALLGIPVLELLYGISLKEYKTELLVIMAGAVFYGIAFILLSLLTVMRYTVIQMWIYLCLATAAFVFAYVWIEKSGIAGAAYSYTAIMMLEAIIYGVLSVICVRREEMQS